MLGVPDVEENRHDGGDVLLVVVVLPLDQGFGLGPLSRHHGGNFALDVVEHLVVRVLR